MSLRAPVAEPIPGYTLKERIGVGGYGEVWSAQAPGDLSKAVKLVYGHFDDERAARELKALNRIKQVRHPFLLSLERFEIIDGQLIIVSELADMSLKDRFDEVNAEGHGCIPRDELLGYLRDAADALDYMNDRFSLQHLDVKPENLLLVGGRIKVADFGLVKELHDVTSSMMGGLTPVYASPEVFDGRPSQRSDQYSLAIVFQEMLTGVLPFPGKTPAQLASQHVHSRPRLAPLSAADQPIIARALSKDPAQRFPSCRALIDSLSGAAKTVARQSPQVDSRKKAPLDQTTDTSSIRSRAIKTDSDWQRSDDGRRVVAEQSANGKTLVIGEDAEYAVGEERDTAPVVGGRRSDVRLPPAAPVEAPVDLGPLVLDACGSAWRPTLFLGVGGTATRTLRQLRRQLRDRFGEAGSLPSVQMLLLDSDARNLYEATQGDRETSLADCETVALPLRNARDYTAESPQKLAWLSRRWLYNIPRSLQTEGRRPLGRLALLDHADRAFECVRKALAAIVTPEAMAATAASMGLESSSRVPRVFVIASISGGTGSGMVLDMAYAVRTILADLGLSDDGVCGMLTYSTDRNPTAGDLAAANAYACLSELYHYTAADCYPGDAAGGLPPFSASEGAFPHTYLVHLGDHLDDEQFDRATVALASYLYASAVTPAATAFDACREQTPAAEDGASLRSFGVVRIGSQSTALPRLAVEQLCRDVVDRWRGAVREAAAPAAPISLAEMATRGETIAGANDQCEPEHPAADHARGLGLDLETLDKRARSLVDEQLGGSGESIFSELKARTSQSLETQPLEYVQQMLAAIDNVFGSSAVADPPAKSEPTPIEAAIDQRLRQIAGPIGIALQDWIASLIECPGPRVASAARAKQWCDRHLREIEDRVTEQLHERQQALPELEHALRAAAAVARPSQRSFFGRRARNAAAQLDATLGHLIELRCERVASQALIRVLRLIASTMAATGDQLVDCQRELGQLSATFAGASPWDTEADAPSGLRVVDQARAAIAESLRSRIPELVGIVDARLQEAFLVREGGLRNVLQRADAKRSALAAAMRIEARCQILKAIKDAPWDQVTLALPADEDRAGGLRECLNAARPKLNGCGGSQRLVAIAPESMAEFPLVDLLSHAVDPPATIIRDTDSDFVLCYEAQELWIPHVAARLIGDRGDLVHIASRLHTRSDVAWCDLADAVADE